MALYYDASSSRLRKVDGDTRQDVMMGIVLDVLTVGSRMILRSTMSSDYSYFVPLVLIRGDTPVRAAIMSAI